MSHMRRLSLYQRIPSWDAVNIACSSIKVSDFVYAKCKNGVGDPHTDLFTC